MVKPTEKPNLATNDITLPTAGTDNKIQPPTAIENNGWDQSQKPAAQHFNWLFNKIREWIDYFETTTDTLTSEIADISSVLYDNTYGAVSTIDLATIFSDNPSYRYFKIVIQDCFPALGSHNLNLRVSIDGSTFLNGGNDYQWYYRQLDTSDASSNESNSAGADSIQLGDFRLTSDVGDWVLKFNNPHNTTAQTAMTFEKEHATAATKAIREFGVGYYDTTVDDITGIQLLWGGVDTFSANTRIIVIGSNIPF